MIIQLSLWKAFKSTVQNTFLSQKLHDGNLSTTERETV